MKRLHFNSISYKKVVQPMYIRWKAFVFGAAAHVFLSRPAAANAAYWISRAHILQCTECMMRGTINIYGLICSVSHWTLANVNINPRNSACSGFRFESHPSPSLASLISFTALFQTQNRTTCNAFSLIIHGALQIQTYKFKFHGASSPPSEVRAAPHAENSRRNFPSNHRRTVCPNTITRLATEFSSILQSVRV